MLKGHKNTKTIAVSTMNEASMRQGCVCVSVCACMTSQETWEMEICVFVNAGNNA